MDTIFSIVYQLLKNIESLTGLTYHEVNIITYYIIVPMVFIYMIGRILQHQKLFKGFAGYYSKRW
ncbi:hypothetical protein [Neptunitalea chrysea]|uniref:hypothetical protein n=1 Tax=Neptunitalea chrysea TaxID=1647581 RepID=UPI002493A31E|nr:hypothetical protein [Neptunitalea chrysea]